MAASGTSYYVQRKTTTNHYYETEERGLTPTPPPRSGRMTPVSVRDMNQMLSHIKTEQSKNVVYDTLAALVTDVNATTEVLRKGIPKEVKVMPDYDHYRVEEVRWRSMTPESRPMTPQTMPFPTMRKKTTKSPSREQSPSVYRICSEFGIDLPTRASIKRRARSETPTRSSRIIVPIEESPKPYPTCAACMQLIEGACITALAPNSERAQKYHPQHFVCTYCQKALNLHGTYREHQKKPYCHECFYRLYSGHIYTVPE